MVKISITDGQKQRHLMVEGTLVAPWVAEWKAAVEEARAYLYGRELLVELTDVTAINQEAENALLALMNEGVTVRCYGVFIKHVLEELARRRQTGGQKAGRR